MAIFSIAGSPELDRAFHQACELEGIRFIPVVQSKIEHAGAMLARLFLDRIAPAEYSQLLYIDGDTQIIGGLTPLLEAKIPAGQFCAVSDPMTFSLEGEGRHERALVDYFASIGLADDNHRNYFNSGVLRINRTGWDEIGLKAWQLFQDLKGKTRYPDQDALNLAAMDRRVPMSLAWNFPIFLRNARLEEAIKPRIVHYMGSPKPWHGAFLPWGSKEYEAYLAAVTRYPALAPFLTSMPWYRRLRYVLQQRYKRERETSVWGTGTRHSDILHYEDRIRNGAASVRTW